MPLKQVVTLTAAGGRRDVSAGVASYGSNGNFNLSG